MNLSSRVLNLLVVVTTFAAVVAVGQWFYSRWSAADSTLISEQRDWQQFASEGISVGDSNAPVTITVFSDFQCPFCKTLADSIGAILPRYSGQVRMVFRNRPLEAIHPHAQDAARAAVCADKQGRFLAFHDALFADQKQIGIRSWSDFAVAADISDTIAFARCREDPAAQKLVELDVAAAKELKLTGTPLLLVNETMIRGVPPGRVLDSLVQLSIASNRSRR